LQCIALTGGCVGASLSVHVRDARRHRPIANASVLLYDSLDDPCEHSASGGQLSSGDGAAHVQTRWCGRAKLVVAAAGYTPVSRELDTCDTHTLRVVLARLPAEPTDAADSAVATASAFVAALRAGDKLTLQRLLADANDASLYTGHPMSSHGRQCAVRFVRASRGPETRVEFASYCDTGCHESWVVRVTRHGEEWRVRALTVGPLTAQQPAR
jgi:hypothetical protein